MDWSDKDLDTLRELRAQRLSFSVIGKRMGRTKNACVGKAQRLGLSQTTALVRKKPVPIKRLPKPKRVAPIPPEPLVQPSQFAVSHGPVTFMQLTDKTCRWPMSLPDGLQTVFCGSLPKDGAPYCDQHCFIAYVRRTG